MNEQEVLHAMRQISSVIAGSPHAADTLDGIHTCWIRWIEPRPDERTTEAALRRLESEGAMECVTLEGGRQVWRRVPARGTGA